MKLSKESRKHVFWGVCIPTRLYLTQLGRERTPLLRPFAAYVAYRWMSGLQVGDEGMFGGPAWWADSRKTHGKLWAGYALTEDWRFLAADVILGMVNWYMEMGDEPNPPDAHDTVADELASGP